MEDIRQIMQLIPHRYPFLLVDRITLVEESRIMGLKNVSINEPYFQGHFPSYPIMPGVLIVEGMAQCAGCLMARKVKDIKSKLIFFTGIDNVKFRKPVVPGDQIKYQIDIVRLRGNRICKFKGISFVDDEIVCEGDMTASLIDNKDL